MCNSSSSKKCAMYHKVLIDKGCFSISKLPPPIRPSDDENNTICNQLALDLENAENKFKALNVEIQKARDVSSDARNNYNQNCTKTA